MTTTISKSQVMKRAWRIFKGSNPYSYSFSASLRRAWHVEKANIRYEAEQAEQARIAAHIAEVYERRRNLPPVDYALACAEAVTRDYWNARPGTYFGD